MLTQTQPKCDKGFAKFEKSKGEEAMQLGYNFPIGDPWILMVISLQKCPSFSVHRHLSNEFSLVEHDTLKTNQPEPLINRQELVWIDRS